MMAEKKIQENPIPESSVEAADRKDMSPDKPKEEQSKPEAMKVQTVPSLNPLQRLNIPSFTKTPPNELYKKLLPAVLFVITFVTVMTLLLIYMDTVALGAQQFRLNMSQDYELAKIPAENPTLIAYVRQLYLSPRPSKNPPQVTTPTKRVEVMDKLYGEIYNGTLVEILPRGARTRTALYLETARGWRGTAVRAAPRDFLALRAAAAALHACLSPTHPREVSYQESEGGGVGFSSRVLCLPLVTVLRAAGAPTPDLVLLAGHGVASALHHFPFSSEELRIAMIDFRSTDMSERNKTTEFLLTKNYTVAATFDDGIMYALNQL